MQFSHIDHGGAFDFGRTAESYAKYRDIYPEELYVSLHEIGVGGKGKTMLDLGTGTGVIALHMARYGGDITGIDISPEQIAYARRQNEQNGTAVRFLACPAEQADFADNSFDSITAAQCFWYFDQDMILRRIRSWCRDGGIFCKIYMTYTLQSEIAKRSHELVKTMNPGWTPEASGSQDMTADCFPGRVTESFWADIPFTRESWHGRMTACRGTLASMDTDTFRRWETAHLAMLEEYGESFSVPHKIFLSYFTIKK